MLSWSKDRIYGVRRDEAKRGFAWQESGSGCVALEGDAAIGCATRESSTMAKSTEITAATTAARHATNQLMRAGPLTSINAAPINGAAIMRSGACARISSR